MNTRQLLKHPDFRGYLADAVMDHMLYTNSDEIADYSDKGDAVSAGWALLSAIAEARDAFEDDHDRPSQEEVNAERRRVGLPPELPEDELNRRAFDRARG